MTGWMSTAVLYSYVVDWVHGLCSSVGTVGGCMHVCYSCMLWLLLRPVVHPLCWYYRRQGRDCCLQATCETLFHSFGTLFLCQLVAAGFCVLS
jgi:hypothetical protein